MTRSTTVLLGSAFTLLAACWPSAASAQALECGDVVTTDVVLEASLTGCTDGLTVDGDGVTIDLDGHAIRGVGPDGGGIGIVVRDRADVTIVDGSVSGFSTGVALSGTTGARVSGVRVRDVGRGISVQGGTGTTIAGNAVTGAAEEGISAGGSADRVVGNAVTDSGTGFSFRTSGDPAVVEHNVAWRNAGTGFVFLFSSAASVRRNVASENGGSGFAFERSNVESFERNVATGNGTYGVVSSDSHGRYIANVTNANGAVGLLIVDSLPDHGRFFTVAGNVSNGNEGLGILVSEGMIDGGRNRARANGDSRQCVNVACNVQPAP